MRKTHLGIGLLCALLSSGTFEPVATAQPVVDISGPEQAWVVMFSGQAFATSWAQTNEFTNVTVTVSLSSFGMPGQTGRAYLTTRLGPGTTSADEIASTEFAFPLERGDVTLFSGLTLGASRYYLSLVGNNSEWGSGWLSGCAARFSLADGVSLGPDYGFSGVGPYLPATGVWEQPVVFMRFSVFSSTNYPAPEVPFPNEPPVATNQSITVMQNTPISFALNVGDPDSPGLGVMLTRLPAHGTLSARVLGPLSDTGCFPLTELIYTPELDFFGTDGFDYVVIDGFGGSSAGVTIAVEPPNRPPEASAQSAATEFEIGVRVTLSGSDPDADPLTYSVVDEPSHGTLSGTPPTLTYTPAAGFFGVDTFRFTVSDGEVVSAPAVVSIAVGSEDDPPFAPVNLVAIVSADHQITLTWMDRSSREKGFRVERASDGITFKEIANLRPDITSYVDGGVQAGKTYTYRVRAYSKNGKSDYSNVAAATP